MLTIYGDRISGNCLKVKWVADHLGLDYEGIDVDVVSGGAKTPAYLADFPMGRVSPGPTAAGWRSRTPSSSILPKPVR